MSQHQIYESPKKGNEYMNPYQDNESEEPKQKIKRHSRSINKSITSDGGGVSSVRNLKKVNIDKTKSTNIKVIQSFVEKEDSLSDQSCNILRSHEEEFNEDSA